MPKVVGEAAAGLFGIMPGEEIDVYILDTPQYDEIIKPISAPGGLAAGIQTVKAGDINRYLTIYTGIFSLHPMIGLC